MSKTAKSGWMLVLVGVCILGYGAFMSHFITKSSWKKEAIEEGHAEWYIDGHHMKWRWIEHGH